MSEAYIKGFIVKTVVLFVLVLTGLNVLEAQQNKEQEQVTEVTKQYYEGKLEGAELFVTKEEFDEAKGQVIKLTLPADVKKEQIGICDSYMDRKLVFTIQKDLEDFLSQQDLSQKVAQLKKITFFTQEDVTTITLRFQKVYGYYLYYDKGNLWVKITTPKNKYKKIVVVDPGHGGEDPGSAYNGIVEKEVNLQVVNKLYSYMMEEEHIKVYYTRQSDVTLSGQKRIQFANEVGADFYISIHCNYVDRPTPNGTEVLYSETSDESKQLAEIALEEMTQALGLKKRGLVKGNGIYIIRNAKMPIVLLELGFISNEKDAKVLTDSEKQKELASSIVTVIKKGYSEFGD
ncbi:MAG: N-acetylmuramoyl-L-alanine amidase [Lachnospiraceae bacterium]|nr:N-acetylmuramoyl-L-alanine amidase [Lachnospiraceae bacterium]MEE1342836.1 N-acetylmuramoyl-L-alanine amidase [Lachnospiraceae bacterium]